MRGEQRGERGRRSICTGAEDGRSLAGAVFNHSQPAFHLKIY